MLRSGDLQPESMVQAEVLTRLAELAVRSQRVSLGRELDFPQNPIYTDRGVDIDSALSTSDCLVLVSLVRPSIWL